MASEKIRARLVRLHNANKRKRVRWAITGVLVVVVAVATTLAMTRPMIAQKKVAHCGKLEHVHTKDCLSEVGGCQVEEHVHTLSCFSDATADLETKDQWEATLPSASQGEALLSRVVAIARSQLGYRESSKNYLVRDGEPHGRNRYATWAGSPYADWNAAFACFCLGYAGVGEDAFPRATNAMGWETSLRSAGMLVEAGDPAFAPAPGDLAFVRVGDELVAGVVSSVDSQTGEVRLVAGDVDDAVRELKALPAEGGTLAAATRSAAGTVGVQGTSSAEGTSTQDSANKNGEDAKSNDDATSNKDAKTAASLQDGDDLGRGSSLLVDDAVASLKKSGSGASEASGVAGAKSAAVAGGAGDANSSSSVAGIASSLSAQSVPAVQSQDPVIVAYGKMPEKLRKEYDTYEKQLAQKQAEKQAGEESQEDKTAGSSSTAHRSETTTKEFVATQDSDTSSSEADKTSAEQTTDGTDAQPAPVDEHAIDPIVADPTTAGSSDQADANTGHVDSATDKAAVSSTPGNPTSEGDVSETKAKSEESPLLTNGVATDGGVANTSPTAQAALEVPPTSDESATKPTRVLTTKAAGYEICAEISGDVPDDCQLKARVMQPNAAQIAKVEEDLSENLPNGIRKEAHVDASDMALLNIKITDKDGNKIEPNTPVHVSMQRIDLRSNFIGSVAVDEVGLVAEADESDAPNVPEVIHFKGNDVAAGTETLPAEPSVDGFAFTTTSFSPFAFVYTVDFEYEGFTWSMPGGGTALLSQVLAQLQVADFSAQDVVDATFSNPELVAITPQSQDGARDWLLTSLKPFSSEEKLTLILEDSSTVTVNVTDEDTTPGETQDDTTPTTQEPQDIQGRLDRVEFYDGATLVGDTSSPDAMVVRPGHEYTMRLHFSENEDIDPSTGQFTDDGKMRYAIPNRVHLSERAFDENRQVKFSIQLDRKHVLEGNIVTYHLAQGENEAYLEIEWNKEDKENFKLLKASPRTQFMLSFPYTTVDVEDKKPIQFSSTAILNVEGDPTYDVELEKVATPKSENPEIIDYKVTAVADGNVESVYFEDVMGEALTYIYPGADAASGVRITYKKKTGTDADGNPTYTDYTSEELQQVYNDNFEEFDVATNNRGFVFMLKKLNNSDMAVIEYSARVDYTKLGGKNNIETTSKNTVTAKDKNDKLLDETSQALDSDIDYLQVGKRLDAIQYVDAEGQNITGESHQNISDNWKYMYAHWQVIYNPDHKINVEGATLTDTVWMGKKYSTTYATDKPFTVTAYSDGTFKKDDGSTGDTFTPDGNGVSIIVATHENGNGWNDVNKGAVTVKDANYDADPKELSSWEWMIPQKSATVGMLDVPYVYVIDYWTKIAKDGPDSGGYVGNQVTESIASITRDKAVELPGVGPGSDISVDKEHLQDDYDDVNGKVYTQWQITFDRRASSMERALVEDTLPHLRVTDSKGDRIYRDVFVNKEKSEDAAHGWEVTGLFSEDNKKEQCVPSVSADGYDVVFWFFKNQNKITNPDINTAGQGLYGTTTDMTDENKKITITFWTENDNDWIRDAADGKAKNEHWNHVHLILNGKEAVDNEYAVPKPRSEIKKRVEEAGSWTDGNTTLPVYRYTLTLSGITDDAFIPVPGSPGNYTLTVTDEFSGILDYLSASSLPTCADKDHMSASLGGTYPDDTVTLTGRNTSDEQLIRAIPKSEPVLIWPATFPNDATVVDSSGDGKKQLTITIPVTAEQREQMKYTVMQEDGVTPVQTLINPNDENEVWKDVKVYGRSYEVSYYLAPDFQKVKDKAQAMVNANETENTKLTFQNEATWENVDGEAGKSSFTAITDYDLKPVKKKLLSYDPNTEVATYSIEINPLKLTMNNGQRYSVQDSYEHMAVDFQTVRFETDPEYRDGKKLKDTIEWTYHNNKGTFWLPDQTKVTITYEGWPVGQRSEADLTFSNTASIGGYVDNASGQTKLSVDHEGYASSYHVRIFKFEDDNMETPLAGAVFQLFEKDASGHVVPMEYKVGHSAPIEDDIMWQEVNLDRQAAEQTPFPTPENHQEGQYIYFVTGNGQQGSADKGFADVMLSQSRDGVALKKNKQYYLREVKEPDGHVKEDIDWRFIIGDNDDWDSYVYSDDSILQVSNASIDSVLTVRKTFIDRTSAQIIASNYDNQKDMQFEIVGRDNANNVIYNKIKTYDDFMRVATEWEGEGEDRKATKHEWLLKVHKLPAGNYTVREVNTSAQVVGTSVTTTIEGKGSVKRLNNTGQEIELKEGDDPNANFHTGQEGNDILCTFTVPASDIVPNNQTAVEHTKTSVEAEFTNTYTDEDPVSLVVEKQWDNGGKDAFVPAKAEFELYADGKKYELSKSDGSFVNDKGNIEITAGTDSSWSNDVEISNLPRKKTIKTISADGKVTYSAGHDIVWTVKEISATYNTGGTNATNTTVEGIYLKEHFTTKVNGLDAGEKGNDFNEDGEALFTNTFNNLTTVKVTKTWSDHNETIHTDDSVFFDLYRTTQTIENFTLQTLKNLSADTEKSELVISNIELSANNNPTKNFTYENSLLEKKNNVGDVYHYFVLERSVAGYSAAYAITETAGTAGNNDGKQELSITNSPLDWDPRGNLTLSKSVYPNTLVSKDYKFTLQNSGKYVQSDGSLGTEPHEFTVSPSETDPVEITNLKPGTYILTEVRDSTQIGGYNLVSTMATVTVTESTEQSVTFDGDLSANITVEGANTKDENGDDLTEVDLPTTAVVVTNTYTKDVSNASKTDFQFGKLWVMPNVNDSTTLPWPNNTNITMTVQRRIKGTNNVDGRYSYSYTFSKLTGDNITENHTEGAPALTITNPDVTTSSSSSSSGSDSESHTSGESGTTPTNYHHYTFTMSGLDKYDDQGNEWEYFATETAVTDGTNNLLSPENQAGKYYKIQYGYVDGIGAGISTGENGEPTTEASTKNGVVGYAINRLAITEKVKVSVKKFINGWPTWEGLGVTTSNHTLPEFTFRLYNSLGKPVLDENNQITGVSNSEGIAELQIPDSLINPNDMIWWSDEEVLYGMQTFWIKEDPHPSRSEADPFNTSYAYNGITDYTGAAQVILIVKYKWLDGTLTSKARVADSDYRHPGENTEYAVINNAYDPGETEITVSKTWNDVNNQDGYRRPLKFKVYAKYYVRTGGDLDEGKYQSLNKVWSVKDGKATVSDEEKQKDKEVNVKVQDVIVLNKTEIDAADVEEYRITLDPTKDGTSKTVKLPAYYEGHKIIYTVEERLNESVVEKGKSGAEDVTLYNKYTKSSTSTANVHNFTNTHTPEKVNVSVEKTWTGNDSDVNSHKIQVQLKASYDGGSISSKNEATNNSNWNGYANEFDVTTIAKGSDDKWRANWTGLPRFAPGLEGKEVTYTVEEVPSSIPMGYHQTSNVSGKLTEANGQSGTYSQSITVTNEYDTVNITPKKIWDDDNNRDNLRNENTTVTFTISATVGDSQQNIIGELITKETDRTVTLGASNATQSDSSIWENNTVWQDLPKYYHGQEINYKVTETQILNLTNGDTMYSNDGPSSSGTITNTHELIPTQITLTKAWDDGNNRDNKRPDPVTFVRNYLELTGNLSDASGYSALTLATDENPRVEGQPDNEFIYVLLCNGTPVKDAQVKIVGTNGPRTGEADLIAYNTYTITFTVPRYRNDPNGRSEVDYKLKENAFTDQNAMYTRVYAQGETVPSDGGINIVYPEPVDKNTKKQGTAYAENIYNPEHINLKVVKTWEHGSNESNPNKPQLAQVELKATVYNSETQQYEVRNMSGWKKVDNSDYSIVANATLNENNQYTHVWQDLPVHVPDGVGEVITYQIDESNVPEGYHLVANTVLATDPATVPSGDSGSSDPDPSNNTDPTDPADPANPTDPTDPVGPADETPWHIINANNVYEKTKVTANKVWDDANNQDGLRKNVQFKLQRCVGDNTVYTDVGGAEVKQITSLNPTAAEWDNLPAWVNNERVHYKVVEVPPAGGGSSLSSYLPGYNGESGEPTLSGFTDPSEPDTSGTDRVYEVSGTVTNTHVPQTVDLSFSKTWDHKGVPFDVNSLEESDARIPQNYLTKLHLWARVKASSEGVTPGDLYKVEDTDWRSNASITDDYHVTITGLPYNKPKTSVSEGADELEYFIGEDENDIVNYSLTTTPTTTTVEAGTETNLVQLPTQDNSDSVMLTNTRDTGTLKVSKSVVSDLKADHSLSFSFVVTTNPPISNLTSGYHYTITNAVDSTTSGGYIQFANGTSTTAVSLKDTETLAIEGLPVGVTYTATEAINGAFTSNSNPSDPVPSDPSDDNAQSVVHPAAGSQTLTQKNEQKLVAFTNTRKTGELSVAKTISSSVDADKTKDFWFKVELRDLIAPSGSITYDGVVFTKVGDTDTYEGTFVLQPSQMKTFHNLPIGATYTVTELSTTSGDSHYDANLALTSSSGTTGTIGETVSASTFANKRNVGNLVIKKELTNHIPVDDGDVFYFDVQLKDGNDHLALDLMSGTQIHVGRTVIKSTVSNTKPYYDANTYTIKNVPVKLGDDGTTITGLPLGVTAVVKEDHFTVADKSLMTHDNITMDSTASRDVSINQDVTFTNVRKKGGLKISKLVNSPVDKEKDKDEYTVRVSLKTKYRNKVVQGLESPANLVWSTDQIQNVRTETREFASGHEDITIKNGETVTITGIPTDVLYTITEPDVDTNVFDKTFTVSSTPAATDSESVTAEVMAGDENAYTTTITNEHKVSNLTVSKTVASSVPADKTSHKKYHFEVVFSPDTNHSGAQLQNVTYTVNGSDTTITVANNTATFDLEDTQQATITGVPVGWTYIITESDGDLEKAPIDFATHYTTTWMRTGEGIETKSGTTNQDTRASDSLKVEDENATVQFTNTRNTGELKINKQLENSIPTDEGKTFYFDVVLEFDDTALDPGDARNQPIQVNNKNVPVSAPAGDHPLWYDMANATLKNVPVKLSTQNSGSTTISNLPQGTQFNLSENQSAMPTNNIALKTNQSNNRQGTIGSTPKEELFENTRKTGYLHITKMVVSPVDTEYAPTATYNVQIELKTKEEPQKPVPLTNVGILRSVPSQNSSGVHETSQATINFNDQGIAVLEIHPNETVTVGCENASGGIAIPTDVLYTITEPNLDTAKFDKSFDIDTKDPHVVNEVSASAEIIKNDPKITVITNTRKTGDIEVQKITNSSVATDKNKYFKYVVELAGPSGSKIDDKVYGEETDDKAMSFTYDSETGKSKAEFILKSGETETATGLPIGWEYTVTESEYDSTNDSEHPGIALSKFNTTWTRTIGGTTTATDTKTGSGVEFPAQSGATHAIDSYPQTSDVAFVNERKTGSLTINKILADFIPDDVNAPGDTFYFDVELTGEDGQKLEPSADAPIKVNNVAINTAVSADMPYYDTAVTPARIRNVPISIGQTGSNATGSVTIDGLPVGTKYKVTENENVKLAINGMDANNVARDSAARQEKTIPEADAGATSAATQTESFNNNRKMGNISIAKTVNNTNVASENERTFTVKVTLKTKHGNQPVQVTNVPVSPSTATVVGKFSTNENGVGTITIKHGETVTIGNVQANGTGTGIPTDVEYTIEELEAPEFSKTYTADDNQSQSADIIGYGTSAATVTNTRLIGNLTVAKSVVSVIPSDKTKLFDYEVEITGPLNVKVGSNSVASTIACKVLDRNNAQPRTFDFDNTGNHSKASFSLIDGEKAVIENLPVGVTYTVTEKPHAGNDGISLDKFITTWTRTVGNDTANGTTATSPDSGSDVTNTISTDASSVSYTNTRKTTDLKLVKEVETPFNKDKDDLYTFEVELKHDNNGIPEVLQGPFDVTTYNENNTKITTSTAFDANGKAQIKVKGRTDMPTTIVGVPLDTIYTVTEILDEPKASFFEKSADVNGTINAVPGSYEAKITNTRKMVPVSFLKVSAENNDRRLADAEFTMTPVVAQGQTSPVSWTSISLRSDSNGLLAVTSVDPSTESGIVANQTVFQLPQGTYQLEETKAPTGYHKLTAPIQFTVTASSVSYTDGTGSHLIKVNELEQLQYRSVHINIENSTGAELPSTGGPGLFPLLWTGVALFCASCVALYRDVKRG